MHKHRFPSVLLTAHIMILLGTCWSSRISLADHLPPKLQAKGKPEKTVASIHLDRITLKGVIKVYGKPERIIKQNVNDLAESIYDYYWKRAGVLLIITAHPEPGTRKGWYVYSIAVEGSDPRSRMGRTGKGLKLGDSKTAIKKIYGARYSENYLPQESIHEIMVQWQRDGTSLIAELDRGKIKRISLDAGE
jgi:hypothetical protein